MYITSDFLDKLARGEYNPHLKKTIDEANQFKVAHRFNKNGYTPAKDHRFIGEIPKSVFFHPEFKKYFDAKMDSDTMRKSVYRFLRKYPQYCTVDKL